MTIATSVFDDGGTWSANDRVFVQGEPELEFRYGQTAPTPQAGLSLYGPYTADQFDRPRGLAIGAIGTADGLGLLDAMLALMQRPIVSVPLNPATPFAKDPYLWPPFPGFAATFLCELPAAAGWRMDLDPTALAVSANRGDQFQRAYEISGQYLNALRIAHDRDPELDVMVCVVPDEVYKNCRPKSRVVGDAGLWVGAKQADVRRHSRDLFDERPIDMYDFSVDFRRQLKARAMEFGIPIQIVRESTLIPRETTGLDKRNLTKLSDRAWNLGAALYYKAGGRPWRVGSARPGVCYIGLAFRRLESSPDPRSGACAAQMFLKSGEGVVFRGEFGPWYSPQDKLFRLTPDEASNVMRGVIQAHKDQGGEDLQEIFLHARSDVSKEEFGGFKRGCPEGVKLVGIRVRPTRDGLRLYRPGKWVVLRGTTWIRGRQRAYLWGSGFKPSVLSYDGQETPRPLRIDIQHGHADIAQVAADVLALTKLNYNTCRVGDAQPVTVRFSDAVGEILIGNPTIRVRRPQFKFYI